MTHSGYSFSETRTFVVEVAEAWELFVTTAKLSLCWLGVVMDT